MWEVLNLHGRVFVCARSLPSRLGRSWTARKGPGHGCSPSVASAEGHLCLSGRSGAKRSCSNRWIQGPGRRGWRPVGGWACRGGARLGGAAHGGARAGFGGIGPRRCPLPGALGQGAPRGAQPGAGVHGRLRSRRGAGSERPQQTAISRIRAPRRVAFVGGGSSSPDRAKMPRPQREGRVFGAVSETSKQRELVAEFGARRFDLVEPGPQLLRLCVEASQFTPEAIPLRGGGAL